MDAVPDRYVSLDEYFALEETCEVKHEYCQGAIFAMTGTTANHNLITLAVGSDLHVQLKGKPCRPFSGDFRLKIEAAGLYTYPDITVICGDIRFADRRKDTFVNPTLIIEVLSERTETYDRGKKAKFYRTIPTLQEYLLVSQDQPLVERYRRQGQDWLLSEYSMPEDEVALDSIGCTLSVASIYARVSFDER